jgi:hypothetical protein
MNIISWVLLLTLVNTPLILMSYLIFSLPAFGQVLLVQVVIYFLAFSYIDKYILIRLQARKLSISDNTQKFQAIKNRSYIANNRMLDLYIYSGQQKSFLILNSGGRLSVVIERSQFELLDFEQFVKLIDYAYTYSRSGFAWQFTKVVGFKCLLLDLVSTLLAIPLRYKLKSFINMFMTIVILLLKPVWDFLNYYLAHNKNLIVPKSLENIYWAQQKKNSENKILNLVHCDWSQSYSRQRSLQQFVESYSPFENAQV